MKYYDLARSNDWGVKLPQHDILGSMKPFSGGEPGFLEHVDILHLRFKAYRRLNIV